MFLLSSRYYTCRLRVVSYFLLSHGDQERACRASGETARNDGGSVSEEKETAIGSLIWRFAAFHAFVVTDSSFTFDNSPCSIY